MEKLIINIGASSDHYGAYAENCDGIYAGGSTIQEVKTNVLESIRLLKKEWPKERIPELLKGEYEIEYKYDVASFLKYYSGIMTLSGLSRLTGVNQGLLSHYVNGLKKPRKETIEKIESRIRKFGRELSQIDLV
ncbi:MAG: helix-turn-helix domain-containing protein [Mangrovibacterium sp.]